MPKKTRLCVYAGSFDPLTVGHLWMIEQGALLFGRLIVALGINPEKHYTFTLEDRLAMLRESLRHFRNVSVTSFSTDREAGRALFVNMCPLRFIADFLKEAHELAGQRALDNPVEYE